MAGVLTDQSLNGSLVAPLALTTNPAQPQLLQNGKFGRTGNATVFIPGTGRTTRRRFSVRVIGRVATTVANNTVTINVLLNGNVYATTGAKTINAKTGVISVFAEFLYDPLAANMSGTISGHADNSPIAAAPLSATNNIALDTEGNTAGFTVQVGSADAGATFTLYELTLEIL